MKKNIVNAQLNNLLIKNQDPGANLDLSENIWLNCSIIELGL